MFCLILRIFLVHRHRLDSERTSALNHPRDLIYRTDLEVCLSVFIISLLLCRATVFFFGQQTRSVFIMRSRHTTPPNQPLLNCQPVSSISPYNLRFISYEGPFGVFKVQLVNKRCQTITGEI